MRIIIALACIGLLASCSSPEKRTAAPAPTPTTTAAPTSAPAPAPVVDPVEKMTQTTFPMITGKSLSDVNCTRGADVRKVSLLERTDDKGWGVTYSKGGQTNTIAIARYDKDYCPKVVEQIRSTLSENGFKCDGSTTAGATPGSGTTGS